MCVNHISGPDTQTKMLHSKTLPKRMRAGAGGARRLLDNIVGPMLPQPFVCSEMVVSKLQVEVTNGHVGEWLLDLQP